MFSETINTGAKKYLILSTELHTAGLSAILCFSLLNFGCQRSEINQPNDVKVLSSPASTPSEIANDNKTVIDVPRLAYHSAAEIEKILGQPAETKIVKGDAKQPPGEYRLYRMRDHPQGLSVHFYNDRAIVFNLVLGEAVDSPRRGLLEYFAIDVKDAAPVEKTQFLEKWQGNFNGVNFATVYAMKERIERNDYKLLHAEVAR